MKKFIVFILSFVLLYFVFQIGSGLLLTSLHTPDFTPNNQFSGEVVFGQTSIIPFLGALLIAALAYVVSQKTFTLTKKIR
ncbi:hypothetical protein [Jeotgalibacillus proteolyticus]|uniref:Uncharacterized protein n=1 Tax=Jeotgalibacillus proteolyticus TaxID=2082395 RepID=A0A2S5G948_9BACL|nr:hypothetical protein [Jeotgalibacillus proteolyticus]PPA69532.1 hypothetical protein C4B60_13355 [Jeotgalibacillus proteolyticus]